MTLSPRLLVAVLLLTPLLQAQARADDVPAATPPHTKGTRAAKTSPAAVKPAPPKPEAAAAVTPPAQAAKLGLPSEPQQPVPRERPQPKLSLSPTPAELREIERRRAVQADLAERQRQRRILTQTGDTSGPGGRAGAGTSQDRKQSVSEGIGPDEGGNQR